MKDWFMRIPSFFKTISTTKPWDELFCWVIAGIGGGLTIGGIKAARYNSFVGMFQRRKETAIE